MVLIDKILNILNSIEGINTVLYESPYFANIKIDRKPEPYAVAFLLEEASLDLTYNLKEGVDMEIFFCKSVKLDADGKQQQAIVDDCMYLAKQFLLLLKEEKNIVIPETINIRTGFGRWDKNVTGVTVELSLRERQGKCLDAEDPKIRTLHITENGSYDVTHYGRVEVEINQENDNNEED